MAALITDAAQTPVLGLANPWTVCRLIDPRAHCASRSAVP